MACCLGNNKITALEGKDGFVRDMNTKGAEGGNENKSRQFDGLQDMHGFQLRRDSSFVARYIEWQKAYTAKQSERSLRWSDVLKRSLNSKFTRSNELKKLVRKGIPNALRGQVWMDLSGATQKMSENPGLYRKHVDGAEIGANASALAQIELDLHRTFPDHPFFSQNSAKEIGAPVSDNCSETDHIQSLRRVLRAYAHRNTLIGYCQGMNFIAGIMLLFLEEERAYWLLVMLLEAILPQDYYSQELLGCNVDLRVFGDLLSQKLPKIAKTLHAFGVGVEFFALEWFIALFSKTFPSETVLRIWDCIFCEGDKILFRLGLGILRTLEKEITRAPDQNEMFQMVQGIGKDLLDVDILLKTSFAFYVQRDQIRLARIRFREDVDKERQARASRITKG